MNKRAQLVKDIFKGKCRKCVANNDSKEEQEYDGIAEENLSENDLLNLYMRSKGLNPKTASKFSKIAASKTGDYNSWVKRYISGGRLVGLKKEQLTITSSPTLKRQKVLDRAFHRGAPIPTPGMKKEEVDEKDTITMDIPLLIRMLEFSREDIKTDADLHKVVEKLISIRNNGTLTMDDYEFVVKLKECLQFEDTFQDTYAATQTVGPETYNQSTDNIDHKSINNQVKRIKKIYKENRQVSEDLYDHEKDDKSIDTPRKKDAKVNTLPNASAIMTGGKTETGKPRDDIEIDPAMKYRIGNMSVDTQTQKKNINK